MARMHRPRVVYCTSRPVRDLKRSPGSVSRRQSVTEPPSPRAPLLRGHYPPSPLLWAHARIPLPLAPLSGCALIGAALAACAIHGWSAGPSRFCSAFLCWSAAPLMPAARRVHVTSSSSATSAFAPLRWARLSANLPQTASRGEPISARQAFLNVAALQLACPPGRSAPYYSARGRLTFELAADSLPPRQSSMLPGRLVNCRGGTSTR